MSDGQRIVMLTTWVEGHQKVIGVFGPYKSEAEASEHVGILRDPEKLKRVPPSKQQISISQHRLEDPSAFTERVDGLLTRSEE